MLAYMFTLVLNSVYIQKKNELNLHVVETNVSFCFQVNFRSLSESLGLQAGDVIVAINGFDISSCKHKEAQEKIVSAGNSFQLTIQRSVQAFSFPYLTYGMLSHKRTKFHHKQRFLNRF